MRKLSIAAVLVVLTASARAEDSADRALILIELLAAPSLHCTFGPGARAAWQDGVLVPRLSDSPAETVDFMDIDIGNATATARGAAFEGEVHVIPAATGMHLYAFGGGGDLSIATVSAARDASGRYLAVLSLHREVDGRLLPEQHYGYCEGAPPGSTE